MSICIISIKTVSNSIKTVSNYVETAWMTDPSIEWKDFQVNPSTEQTNNDSGMKNSEWKTRKKNKTEPESVRVTI